MSDPAKTKAVATEMALLALQFAAAAETFPVFRSWMLAEAARLTECGGNFDVAWYEQIVPLQLEGAAYVLAGDTEPASGAVVHHIDGNPRNNDPADLRIIDPREQR